MSSPERAALGELRSIRRDLLDAERLAAQFLTLYPSAHEAIRVIQASLVMLRRRELELAQVVSEEKGP